MVNTGLDKKVESTNLKQPENVPTKLTWQVSQNITQPQTESSSMNEEQD